MTDAVPPPPSPARRTTSRARWAAAFAVAVGSDVLDAILWPITGEGIFSPVHDALDIVTAIALVVLLGFRWPMALVILPEAIPALSLFPSWTAVLAATAVGDGVSSTVRRK